MVLLLKAEEQQGVSALSCGVPKRCKYSVDFSMYLGCGLSSSESTYEAQRAFSTEILLSASQGRHVISAPCSLFKMLLTFHSLFVSLVYLFAFLVFLLRKWHIFSTSTPPNCPSSKAQTLQKRSVSPTASSLVFAIGLQTALNFYYLFSGPSDVYMTTRKWKESPSLCWC